MQAERTAAAALGAAVTLIPAVWALDVPQHLGLLVYPEQVAGLILGLAVASVFLADIARAGALGRGFDVALALMALWVGIHLFVRFPVLSEGAFFHPTESLVIGIGVVVVTLEALRRTAGWSLIVLLAALVLYALFSDLVPGRLQGRPLPPADVVRFLGSDSTATLGAPLQVAAFVVVLFILFGRLLVATGGADVLTDAARKFAGARRGATAKMAVIASGFMGSISGSAVSNVMSTGVVTIPAMKRAGFQPKSAGAIEAVASTGGQIMPPVMGAAAFLMAEFLRLPYQAIIVAALIPAVLYFYAVYLQISLLAQKHEIGAETDEAPKLWRALAVHAVVVLGPMAMLLVGLFAFSMPASKAVVWASVVLMALGLIRLGPVPLSLRAIGRAVVETGISSAQILTVCAVAGMIIGLLSTSGLSFGLSFVLLSLGEGSMLLLLLLTAAVSILLGMGLPTSGVYLLLATLAAPPLVQLGVGALEAHFFVFYFGLLSMITPPVALAAFAAAPIAGANALATAVESVRFGWIAFVLPFVFVYQPALLMQGSWIAVVVAATTTAVAVPLVTAALIGYGRRPLRPAERAVAAVIGVLAVLPLGGLAIELAFGALGALAIFFHVRSTARTT
ncbi:MAG: TRAP transporter fused permease subunit [Pseudomonadota bacterium]